jgi:hypothetical protein
MDIMNLLLYLFGITNTPTTFMCLMNSIFSQYLGQVCFGIY